MATASADVRNSGCLTLFGAVFAIPGALVAISTLQKIVEGTTDVEQAVLGLTLGTMFAGAGVLLIVWARVSVGAANKLRTAMAVEPDRPWRWREDWAHGYAQAEWRSSATIMTIIAIAFLLFSVPMLMGLARTAKVRDVVESFFILLFPTIGLLLLGVSAVTYLRNRKFQDARVRFAAVPCALGGELAGNVEVDFVFPPGTAVDVKLSSIHSYVTGSGDDRSRWEKVLWQDSRTVTTTTDGRRTSYAPIAFTVPYDCEETDRRNPDDAHLWRLSAKAKLPGLDFAARFEAPVFKTAHSDVTLTKAALEARDEASLRGNRPAHGTIVTGAGADGGLVFYFGPARNVKAAALLTAFGAVFLGAGLFFGFGVAYAFTWILGVIPLVLSGGIGSLLLLGALWLWLGVTTVEVSGGAVHVRDSVLGLSRSKVIPAASIRELELTQNMQAGEQVWYDLKLKLDGGKSVTAGTGLEKNEAEWLRAELKKDLGISR